MGVPVHKLQPADMGSAMSVDFELGEEVAAAQKVNRPLGWCKTHGEACPIWPGAWEEIRRREADLQAWSRPGLKNKNRRFALYKWAYDVLREWEGRKEPRGLLPEHRGKAELPRCVRAWIKGQLPDEGAARSPGKRRRLG